MLYAEVTILGRANHNLKQLTTRTEAFGERKPPPRLLNTPLIQVVLGYISQWYKFLLFVQFEVS